MGTYRAVIQWDGEGWVGWVEEIPGVNSQGGNSGRVDGKLAIRSFGDTGDEPGRCFGRGERGV